MLVIKFILLSLPISDDILKDHQNKFTYFLKEEIKKEEASWKIFFTLSGKNYYSMLKQKIVPVKCLYTNKFQ